MSNNKAMELIGRRYIVEPGDATRYDFSILEVPRGVSGVSDHELEYFTLVIHSPGSGSYEFRKVQTMDQGVLSYALSKMPGVQKYTMAAVLLAAFELVRGEHIDDAAIKMLDAPEYL